jgi:hypothetical protein
MHGKFLWRTCADPANVLRIEDKLQITSRLSDPLALIAQSQLKSQTAHMTHCVQ